MAGLLTASLAAPVLLCFLVCLCPLKAGAEGPNGDPKLIKKVHVVFMNHLDVGYDGIHPEVGFALTVVNRYFTEYFPRAVAVADGLRQWGYSERLVYTTHPWLLYWYLHCQPITLASNVTLQCPNQTALSDMRDGIRRGDVAWHAGPMNMQMEVFHPKLCDLALNFSSILDAEFSIHRTTPVLSQRDVPGMTQSVIPILRRHNIAAVSVGVNSMTSPPALPRTPFLWKQRAGDSDQDAVIAFWHPGGYPDNPGLSPTAPGGLSAEDCLFAQDVDAFPEVLCFAFRQDNSGPPSDMTEVLNNFEVVRGQFPNAMVQASTLDQYVTALKASDTSYPVVTQEVGDTWIFGIQSDPRKIVLYRMFGDVLSQCFDSGDCSLADPRVMRAVFYLTKVPEHTWGLNTVRDFVHWNNTDFQKIRSGQIFLNCEASWQEQREFMMLAFSALGDHPVTLTLEKRSTEIIPTRPNLTDYEQVKDMTSPQTCAGGMVLQFGDDGSLVKLYEPSAKVDWASGERRLGQLLYRTYNETDYDHMCKLYDYHGEAEFHKPNSTQYADPQSREWGFTMRALYTRTGSDNCDFIAKVTPSDSLSVKKYGAPPLFYLHYKSVKPGKGVRAEVEVVVQWFDKGATRLAESVSVGFTPRERDDLRWSVSKLGGTVDPLNVVLNGSQYLHAVDTGVLYSNGSSEVGGLEIVSRDVALLVLGTASRSVSVLPVPLSPVPEPIQTAAFNFYNNLWDTNYIYWYPYRKGDEDFKARFSLNFL